MVIQLEKGRWVVFRDGLPVFSGNFQKVEDWLDQAENHVNWAKQSEARDDNHGCELPMTRKKDSRSDPANFARAETHQLCVD